MSSFSADSGSPDHRASLRGLSVELSRADVKRTRLSRGPAAITCFRARIGIRQTRSAWSGRAVLVKVSRRWGSPRPPFPAMRGGLAAQPSVPVSGPAGAHSTGPGGPRPGSLPALIAPQVPTSQAHERTQRATMSTSAPPARGYSRPTKGHESPRCPLLSRLLRSASQAECRGFESLRPLHLISLLLADLRRSGLRPGRGQGLASAT
jgi:hypothetical protein